MMWLVFRNKWFALAWVTMVCAGVAFRFELSQMIWGSDPTALMAQAAASSAPAEDPYNKAPETQIEQENKARREFDRKNDSERVVSDDAQRPTVELNEHN